LVPRSGLDLARSLVPRWAHDLALGWGHGSEGLLALIKRERKKKKKKKKKLGLVRKISRHIHTSYIHPPNSPPLGALLGLMLGAALGAPLGEALGAPLGAAVGAAHVPSLQF